MIATTTNGKQKTGATWLKFALSLGLIISFLPFPTLQANALDYPGFSDKKKPIVPEPKKHSITAMASLSNTSINSFVLQVSPTLRCSYESGETVNTPVAFRYQYRMERGNRIGIDYMNMYCPIVYRPEFNSQNFGFVGPMIPAVNTNLQGANVHYSKAIDFKLMEIFGFIGLGGYSTGKKLTQTEDYSWYQSATAEFYEFAPAVTHNVLKSFIPTMNFGAGVRFRHLEGGINNQFSLSSPIQPIQYRGNTFNNNVRLKSIGYYIAYRWEF